MSSRSFPCAKCGSSVTNKTLGSLVDKTCRKCLIAEESGKLEERLAKHKKKRQQVKQPPASAYKPKPKAAAFSEVRRLKKEDVAAKEMAQRELSRRHLIPFIQRFMPDYKVGWVHKVFAAKLEKFYEDVKAGKQPRLMIFVPPRHGKSEIVSNNFPSWILGKEPKWEIIMASHTIGLPIRFSKANRQRIDSAEYKAVFPETNLDKTSTSAEEWMTTKRGGLKCAGVGTGISGFGANVFIIDDPIKDYEDAQSPTIRETVKNWYTTTAENRLAPQGGVIVVQTRWNDDDLSGWQLRLEKENREDGIAEEYLQNWEVVSFPAIAESDEYIDKTTLDFFDEPYENRILVRKTGDALHPARYSRQFLLRKKVNMPDNQWSALFQQNPIPASGEYFREEDFMYYNNVPQLHQYPVFFAWDLAIGLRRNNDYTVGVAGALIPRDGVNELYILDMFRNRVRDKDQLQAIVNMYMKYKSNAAALGIEHGQIWLAIEQRLKAAFKKKNTTPLFSDILKPINDKRVRATPLQGWMNNHRVWFPKDQPWMLKAKEELLRFDSGVNDDIVDALAWLVRMVHNRPTIKTYSAPSSGKSTEQMLEEYYRNQGSGADLGYMSQ